MRISDWSSDVCSSDLDAGISKNDIDGYFCSGDAPGMGPTSLVEYLNLQTKYVDSTDVGGASYLNLVNHAVRAIQEDKCSVALVTQIGRASCRESVCQYV